VSFTYCAEFGWIEVCLISKGPMPKAKCLSNDLQFAMLRHERRFLVSAEAAELPVAVVLNKADLVPQEQCEQAVREVEDPGPLRVLSFGGVFEYGHAKWGA
jgi:hypothetical protein